MSTQRKDSGKFSRLDLIKQRHRQLILNPRADMMDGLLEDDETFDSLEDPDDLGHYDDYADIGMEA